MNVIGMQTKSPSITDDDGHEWILWCQDSKVAESETQVALSLVAPYGSKSHPPFDSERAQPSSSGGSADAATS